MVLDHRPLLVRGQATTLGNPRGSTIAGTVTLVIRCPVLHANGCYVSQREK
jgi:hypothetical protein